MPVTKKPLKKVGLPHETLTYTGELKQGFAKIKVINYDENIFEEKDTKDIEDTLAFIDKSNMTWINITGLNDAKIIESMGNFFDLHPLLMEGILDVAQRPKTEEFGDYILIVVKRLLFDEYESEVNDFQISLIIGNNFVISFQEKEDDIFNPIIERISKGKGKIRQLGADYLAYCLLDVVVDNYFIIMQKITEKIEKVEDELLKNPEQQITHLIHKLKRDILFLHRSIWPLREIINKLERAESSYIKESTNIYFRDVQNHIVQIIDTIDLFRETLSGMFEIYLTSVSNRLNQIMKVLTIISTIFMPLSFIASLYGMNLKSMPEINWEWSYFFVILSMILISISMTIYFKKKKWI